jgi:hypothetical protein
LPHCLCGTATAAGCSRDQSDRTHDNPEGNDADPKELLLLIGGRLFEEEKVPAENK